MKNLAAQALANHRYSKMTDEEKEEWKEHMRAIAKRPRKRKSKPRKRGD